MQNRVDRVLAVLRHTFEHGDIFLVEVDEVNSELAALVFVLIKQLAHWYCDRQRMRGLTVSRSFLSAHFLTT